MLADKPIPSATRKAMGMSMPSTSLPGGWLGDRLITRSDPGPRHFADAARRLVPATTVLLNPPGGRVSIP